MGNLIPTFTAYSSPPAIKTAGYGILNGCCFSVYLLYEIKLVHGHGV
jgi:hypothetical protein